MTYLEAIAQAEAVLPLFENLFPGDSRVRVCIEVSRVYAERRQSRESLVEAKALATRAARMAFDREERLLVRDNPDWRLAAAASWAALAGRNCANEEGYGAERCANLARIAKEKTNA